MDLNELIEKLEEMRDNMQVNGEKVNVAILKPEAKDDVETHTFFSIAEVTSARYLDSGYDPANVIWLHMGRY